MLFVKALFRPWVKSGFQMSVLLLVASVQILILLLAVFFDAKLRSATDYFEKNQSITVFLNSTEASSKTQDEAIVDRVRILMGAKAEIKTTHDFLEEIRKQDPVLHGELLGLGQEVDRVVPRYLKLSGIFEEKKVEALSAIPGVESVETSVHAYRPFAKTFRSLRKMGWVVALAVGATLLGSLILVSKIHWLSNQDFYSILLRLGHGRVRFILPLVLGLSFQFSVAGGIAWIGYQYSRGLLEKALWYFGGV